MTMTRLVFAVVSCVYLLIAIPFEERSMRQRRGQARTSDYMRQVPLAAGAADLLTGGLKASGYSIRHSTVPEPSGLPDYSS